MWLRCLLLMLWSVGPVFLLAKPLVEDPSIIKVVDNALSKDRKKSKKSEKHAKHVHSYLPNVLPSVKIKSRDSGMFSLFFDVLYALWEFENGHLSALHVDFGSQGLYFDPNYGNNWWNYYCQPIVLGTVSGPMIERVYGWAPHKAPWYENVPRQTAHALISKYIKPREHILKKVNAFCNQHFSGNYVIGVHYRGTDKSVEAPRVDYETAARKIQETINLWLKQHPQGVCKIFIATDEQAFVDYAHSLWGDCVCYSDAKRSEDNRPLHYGRTISAYQQGEDALVDMLLLSKSQLIIRTSSNLSLWSTYFNPTIPVIELSGRHL